MAKQLIEHGSMKTIKQDFADTGIMAVYFEDFDTLAVDKNLDGGTRKLIELVLLKKLEKGTLEYIAIDDAQCIVFREKGKKTN